METLKVYVKPPEVASLSLKRVAEALIRFKPDWVQIVENEDSADLVILHVIGRREQMTVKARTLKRYAVIQYAIRSTLSPHTADWQELWTEADLVWSYYDLFQLCAEDRVVPHFNFYESALGVDSLVFYPRKVEKDFIITTSGQSYLTESVRECIVAAQDLKESVFHLGNPVRKASVESKTGISDDELADYYSRSVFVSGLRRIEGFELPAAEGLLCGARPIMFDRPHYRKWFNDLAIFIPEGDRSEVVQSLKEIFALPPFPVNEYEIDEGRKRFDWKPIVEGFWERLK